MSLAIPVVHSPTQELHRPDGEIWVGVHTPGTELPERARRILDALTAAGAPLVEARPQPDASLLAVHDPALLDHLEHALERWERAGLDRDPGQDRVVPYIVPHPGMLGELEPAMPAADSARAGYFAYDTMTLIGPGTWEAARGAAEAALTATDEALDGAGIAYALCRPPGHHACRECFGGSCYLNNAAIAAAHLRERAGGPVAVIDLDAHHGNGTQRIFWQEAGVLTGSVHVDPGAGWFPHFLGFESERGHGAGAGANLNLCLAPGSGDEAWLAAVSRLGEWAVAGGASALVLALGVDAAGGDPESPLAVTAEGFRVAGERIGRLGLPAVAVQEGGYALESLGGLVLSFLEGLEGGFATVRS